MSAKLKSMFKKQISWSVGQWRISEEDEKNEKSSDDKCEEVVTLRTSNARRRHRTSLGVLEDIIKCPICKQILQSPRMLDCQHTFCKKCLEILLEEALKNKDYSLCCPVCNTATKSLEPEQLPTNLSVESVLRAVGSSFIEARPSGKSHNLVVNFAPLRTEVKRKNSRCTKCETACEHSEICRHCNQVFCQVCQTIHVAQLKDKLGLIIDQMQVTINKLEHRVQEFKEKSESLKEVVTKEFDAKIAALIEEKEKKLEMIEEIISQEEASADGIRQQIFESRLELIKQKDSEFDAITSDQEKVDLYLNLHKKASEMELGALTWQSKILDMVETKTGDISRLRDKETKAFRPRLISERLELQQPSGLTMDQRKAEIYVACPASRQVIVFDRQYRIMRRIQHASMSAPQSVAFLDSSRELFVTDKWTHAIFVFSRTGHYSRRIGEKGPGEGQLLCPEGIDALQSRNWIYVADTRNDRVQIFGSDGSFKGGIGPNEKAPAAGGRTAARIVGVHKFNQPTDVAVSNSAVVVADCGNHKIKVFNHKGHLMFSFGNFGPFKGLFKTPEAVKLDRNNNILVGDSGNRRVQVFTPQGEFVRAFGGPGSGVGQFGWVSGLLCLPNNEVLVSDNKNDTLTLF